jgi:hypothetical protein
MSEKQELLGVQRINKDELKRLNDLLRSTKKTITDLEKDINRDERTVQLAKRHPKSVLPQALSLAKTSISEDKEELRSEKKLKSDLLKQIAKINSMQRDVEKKLRNL